MPRIPVPLSACLLGCLLPLASQAVDVPIDWSDKATADALVGTYYGVFEQPAMRLNNPDHGYEDQLNNATPATDNNVRLSRDIWEDVNYDYLTTHPELLYGVMIKVSKGGAFSGKIVSQYGTKTFKGKLDPTGSFARQIPVTFPGVNSNSMVQGWINLRMTGAGALAVTRGSLDPSDNDYVAGSTEPIPGWDTGAVTDNWGWIEDPSGIQGIAAYINYGVHETRKPRVMMRKVKYSRTAVAPQIGISRNFTWASGQPDPSNYQGTSDPRATNMPALEGTALPRGHHNAYGTITPNGQIRFSGYTASGTKWSHSTYITESARLPWLAANRAPGFIEQSAPDGLPDTYTSHARITNPERSLGEVSLYWVGGAKGAPEIFLAKGYYGEKLQNKEGNVINGKDGSPTYVFRGPTRSARGANRNSIWYAAGYEVSNVEGVGATYANYGYNQLGSLGLDSGLSDNTLISFSGSDTWNYGTNTTPINTSNSLTLNPKGALIQPSTSSQITGGKFNPRTGSFAGNNQVTYYRLDYNRHDMFGGEGDVGSLDDVDDLANLGWLDDQPIWWSVRQHASIFPTGTRITWPPVNDPDHDPDHNLDHPDVHPDETMVTDGTVWVMEGSRINVTIPAGTKLLYPLRLPAGTTIALTPDPANPDVANARLKAFQSCVTIDGKSLSGFFTMNAAGTLATLNNVYLFPKDTIFGGTLNTGLYDVMHGSEMASGYVMASDLYSALTPTRHIAARPESRRASYAGVAIQFVPGAPTNGGYNIDRALSGNAHFRTYAENDDNPLARPLPFPNSQGAKVDELFPVDFPTNYQFVGVATDIYEAGGVQLERNLYPTHQPQMGFSIKKKYFKVGPRGGILPLTITAPVGQSFSMAFKNCSKGLFTSQNAWPYYPNKVMLSGLDVAGRPVYQTTIFSDTLSLIPFPLRPGTDVLDVVHPDTNLDGVRDDAGLWVQGIYMTHATLGLDQVFNIYVQPWNSKWGNYGIFTLNRYELSIAGQTVVIDQLPYEFEEFPPYIQY